MVSLRQTNAFKAPEVKTLFVYADFGMKAFVKSTSAPEYLEIGLKKMMKEEIEKLNSQMKEEIIEKVNSQMKEEIEKVNSQMNQKLEEMD